MKKILATLLGFFPFAASATCQSVKSAQVEAMIEDILYKFSIFFIILSIILFVIIRLKGKMRYGRVSIALLLFGIILFVLIFIKRNFLIGACQF